MIGVKITQIEKAKSMTHGCRMRLSCAKSTLINLLSWKSFMHSPEMQQYLTAVEERQYIVKSG